MAYYIIAQVKVNDDSWIPDYAAKVHDIVHRHSGKYLSRSGNITTLEGNESTADLVALIKFPIEDALQAFVSDTDYAPYAEARQAGTESQLISIDATDAAGTIPYLTVNDKKIVFQFRSSLAVKTLNRPTFHSCEFFDCSVEPLHLGSQLT